MITPEDLWREACRQCELAQGQAEAAVRFAIAAVYYATYHAAGRALKFDTGASNSNHERLVQILQETNRRAWNRYLALRALRVKAHYHLGATMSHQDLQLAARHGAAVWQLLGISAPEHPGGQDSEPKEAPAQ